MNKQDFLVDLIFILDRHCSMLSDIAAKSPKVIESYRIDHDALRAKVDCSRCHLKNKIVMYELLRKSSVTHLIDRCYRKDPNLLYNAIYRIKANLPKALGK